MLKKLSKKQVHSLLSLLDTISSLNLSPGYSVIWELRPRTVLDIHWNITREDPQSAYAISIRDNSAKHHRWIIDVQEDE